MTTIRCVMMQRDEDCLLEAWFLYYGYLFGYENLTVIDNGSTLPSVLETLRRFEAKGSTILRGLDRVEDFDGKGFHVANVIRSWDAMRRYDFALPVDCDEFLALFTPTGLTCNRNALHAYLDTLSGTREALSLDLQLVNVPLRRGWFRPEVVPKGFLPRGSVEEIDKGFHMPRSRLQPGRRETHLTYLHLHNKGYARTIADARRKLERFVDPDDREALSRYSGPSAHLVGHLLSDEASFQRRYDDLMQVGFDPFLRLLGLLGATLPVLGAWSSTAPAPHQDDRVILALPGTPGSAARETVFDAETYLRLHPDVAGSSSTPLMHYLRFGHGEGRRLEAGSRAAVSGAIRR